MSSGWKKSDFADYRILVVDDEPIIVEMVAGLLRDIGVTTIYKANNGVEALDHFAESVNVIDLVICDWMMPEMDGLEFLHHLRAKHLKIPFIMLTSRTESGHILAAKDEGVTAYLAKPFKAAELREKLGKIGTKLFKEKESKQHSSPAPGKTEK